MSKATSQLYTADESREIDARAIAKLGVTGFTLMQRAAEFAFECLLQRYPGVRRICVLCGKGNNAGDAYLLAVLARQHGLQVQLLAVAAVDTLRGDAALAWQQAEAAGLQAEALHVQRTQLRGEVIVDGLLGTGFTGEPRPDMLAALQWISTLTAQQQPPILSIDVPSGVNASTGAAADCAVRADLTVSFITRKVGLFTGAGLAHAGTREFSTLGVPAHIYAEPGISQGVFVPSELSPPGINVHKHQQGHVVIVGGDLGMPGAVAMAAEAALRAGAGMVSVITQGSHAGAIVSRTPEVMVVDAHADNVGQLLRRADLLVAGPGLGRRTWGETLFDLLQSVSARSFGGKDDGNIPVLLDADGLYWLAQKELWHGGDLYITPHTGEAARLLSCTTAEVSRDRVAAAQLLCQRWQCTGVLKGAGSVIFSPTATEICSHGNPGMATAGMGDVLSGIAGGFLVGPLAAKDATHGTADRHFAMAVNAHSAAADLAAAQVGYRSLLATDVIRALPRLLQQRKQAPSFATSGQARDERIG